MNFNQHHLLPREHGAYAMVLLPQITGLVLGTGATPAAWVLSFSVVAAFLLHEPVAVLLGLRGIRLSRQTGHAAKRRAWILGALTVLAGGTAFVLAGTQTRLALLSLSVLGMAMATLFVRGREKTLSGELWIATAAAGAGAPVALAGGAPLELALRASILWFLIFALGTLGVRAVIDRFKTKRHGLALTALVLGTAMSVVGAWSLFSDRPWLRGGAALLPPTLAVTLALALGATPRSLRRLGWTMAAADTLALMLMIAELR